MNLFIMAHSSDNSEFVDDVDIPSESDSELQSESNGQASNNGRKRLPKPETWKQNVRKKLRNEGKAYYSTKAKKNVEARKIGPPCNDGCFEKVTMPVIESLFQEFWAIGIMTPRQRTCKNS